MKTPRSTNLLIPPKNGTAEQRSKINRYCQPIRQKPLTATDQLESSLSGTVTRRGKVAAQNSVTGNGNNPTRKALSEPRWSKPYHDEDDQMRTGNPQCDPLPKKGTKEREILDAQLTPLYSIAGKQNLPNHENAVLHPNKVFGYLLCEDHNEGKAKANLFKLMGFSVQTREGRDYGSKTWRKSGQDLVAQVRKGLRENLVTESKPHPFGAVASVYMDIVGPNGRKENLRTTWLFGYKTRKVDDVVVEGRISARPWLTSIYKDPKRKPETYNPTEK